MKAVVNDNGQEIEITSTMKEKLMISGYQLTDKEKRDYDYMEDIDSADFFRYCKRLYAIDDFMNLDAKGAMSMNGYWHGYKDDSYFSGIVVHICGDSDRVIVGTYIA